MALFQKSVLNKHLNQLDDEKIAQAYIKFQENYNSNKIEQIKDLQAKITQIDHEIGHIWIVEYA